MKTQIFLAAAAITLTAFGAQAGDTPVTIWSARAPLVNSATSALAAGHMTRAARLAQAAQTSSPHAADKLIAVHDLCLALIRQGKTAAAADPCRAAIQGAAALSSADDALAQRRGALVSGADDGGKTFSLGMIVSDNIARAYGARVVDDMREDVAVAW